MDLGELLTIEEAAEKLGYLRSSVTLMCRRGKLEGAFKIGHQWMIPRKSVENYKKGPQGFAVVWERRREEERQSGHESRQTLEHDIWEGLKALTEKMNRLEEMIAQEKGGA